jgi:hypothetical protein
LLLVYNKSTRGSLRENLRKSNKQYHYYVVKHYFIAQFLKRKTLYREGENKDGMEE